MAVSLDHALDQSLRYRLIGLHGFMDENSQMGLAASSTIRLRGLNRLGELFQVFGPQGELMAQSDGLKRHRVSTNPPPDPAAGILFRNAGTPWFPVRMATQRVNVDGNILTIEVADPQAKFRGVLNEFDSVLFVAVPIAFAIAVLGGYWLSGRALTPVDRIIDEARAISSTNLQARLFIPRSGDELQRLSETLNQMLVRVEQSFRQVHQFTADASHELRAPMTLIYTAAQFALRRDRSQEELKEALRKILLEAKRCTELINQLLWLARAESGSKIELLSNDITLLVEDVVNELTVLAARKGLKVAMSSPELPVRGLVDEVSFRRMMLILVDNAIKYTSPGGRIDVRVMEEANQVTIAVADTGAGIPANDLPFIFDRFWRADRVRGRDAGGTGLGLAIAREIAQHHQAELTVESSIGQGSTFTVRLSPVGGAGAATIKPSEHAV